MSDYLTSCAGFIYSALSSSAWILGLLLKLGHCGTAQGHDWAGAFFRPIDFFFSSADAHEMRPQLSNYTVKSRRYAGICPLWGSRTHFSRMTVRTWGKQFSFGRNQAVQITSVLYRCSRKGGIIYRKHWGVYFDIVLSKWWWIKGLIQTKWQFYPYTMMLPEALLTFPNPHSCILKGKNLRPMQYNGSLCS